MRIVPPADFDTAPVISAGGYGTIVNQQLRDGRVIFGVRSRVGNGDNLFPGAANHKIAADIDDHGSHVRNTQRGVRGPADDIAFNE